MNENVIKGQTVFNTAWSIANEAANKYKESPKAFFADSLRITHARSKGTTGFQVLGLNKELTVSYSATGKFKGAVLSLKRNSYIIAETGFNRAENVLKTKIDELRNSKNIYIEFPKVSKKINDQLRVLTSSKNKTFEISVETYNWLADHFYNETYAIRSKQGRQEMFILVKDEDSTPTKYLLSKSI